MLFLVLLGDNEPHFYSMTTGLRRRKKAVLTILRIVYIRTQKHVIESNLKLTEVISKEFSTVRKRGLQSRDLRITKDDETL